MRIKYDENSSRKIYKKKFYFFFIKIKKYFFYFKIFFCKKILCVGKCGKKAFFSDTVGDGVVVSTTVPPQGPEMPKMRHLVLYKLAGFRQTDDAPLWRKTRGAMRNTFFLKTWNFARNLSKIDQKSPFFHRKTRFFAFFCTFFHTWGTPPIFATLAKIRELACSRLGVA